MNDIFQARLKALRKREGLTQEQLSNLLSQKSGSSVPRTTIAKWESGVQLPTIYSITLLAEIFDTTIDYLSGKEEKPAPVSEGGPLYPSNYDKLNDANKAIVDRLIADLAKNQSEH